MYELLDNTHYLQVARENVVAIIESINQPMVAAAGKSLQPAKSYIVGMRNPSGLFSIYIYLHLTQSHESLVYLHDPGEIPMESYHEQELEALNFVESMGFMVDNLNFRALPPEQQMDLLQNLSVFQSDLKTWAKARDFGGVEDEQGSEDLLDDSEMPDLAPLEGEIMELDEVLPEPVKAAKVIPADGLAKIIRVLASF